MSVSYHIVGVQGENYRASRACYDEALARVCFDSELKYAKEKGGPILWVLLKDENGKAETLKSASIRHAQATPVFWGNFESMIDSALGIGRRHEVVILI